MLSSLQTNYPSLGHYTNNPLLTFRNTICPSKYLFIRFGTTITCDKLLNIHLYLFSIPRIDLTTRVATHRSARDHHSYDDRFNRHNQLRQAGNHHQQQQHVDLYDGLDMPDAVSTRRNSGRHHTLRQRAHHQRQLRQRSTGVRATLSTASPSSQDKMVM